MVCFMMWQIYCFGDTNKYVVKLRNLTPKM